MAGLELSVAIDLYVSDTSRHCDFILPATTMYEREDFPLPFLSLFTTPFIQMTDPVVEPAGEARQEWEVIDAISRRAGVVPSSLRLLRWAGKAGIRLSPERLVDLILRAGPGGDWFGLRRGRLSVAELRRNPHGIVLGEELAGGVLRKKIRHRDKRVRLDAPEVLADARTLAARERPRSGLPAAPDRPARAALAQLLDAQLAAPDARRPPPRGPHPSRRRGAAGIADGEACRVTLAARLDRAARRSSPTR